MGVVVPLWIWLPVVLWVMWRYERGKRIRVEAARWMERVEVVQGEIGRRTEPLALEYKSKAGGEWASMRTLWVALVLGMVSAVLYAWEPNPVTETSTQQSQPSVVQPSLVQSAPVTNSSVQPPPGMIYDPEHNSYHYPPVTSRRHP